jgi:serine/threonine protein kinase
LSDASVHLPPSPADFTAHQLLGTGSFGEVYLVEENSTKQLYAMKVLSKDKIHSQNLLKYAFAERAIMVKMTKVSHPYIVKIKYAFQTDESLFMVTQFCSGGDLSQYLELEGAFSESKARGYIAEVICALECLHSHNIIFRDLKPDNIVLDSQGHALLTDFGLSRRGVQDQFQGADSFCGSYAYLAPEMVNKQGHGKAVDWYLIGVVLFELITGMPPFYDDDKETLFKNIKNNKIEFPPSDEIRISSVCKDLLTRLLNKDPQQRLGGENGFTEIKSHPFFKDVNW